MASVIAEESLLSTGAAISAINNVELNSRLQRQTISTAPFSTKFDDATTDVINLLFCDWLQHATTLHEESKINTSVLCRSPV